MSAPNQTQDAKPEGADAISARLDRIIRESGEIMKAARLSEEARIKALNYFRVIIEGFTQLKHDDGRAAHHGDIVVPVECLQKLLVLCGGIVAEGVPGGGGDAGEQLCMKSLQIGSAKAMQAAQGEQVIEFRHPADLNLGAP